MHTIGDAGSSVPAFLGKLWKLVEDPSTNHLISWNANGLSFMIRDQARFARELLPLYYKHNNMASFVRQLNMYGFHKVVSVDSGGLKLDKDEMEFAHMYFLQGQEFLLEHIKRKIPISKQDETKHSKPEVLTRILSEVRGMKGKQETVDSRLNTMKRENEALWREVAALRQKHMKQQQIVNKLIQFLISIVQPSGRAGLGLKRRYPLMLGEASRISAEAIASGKKDSKAMADTKLKDLDESEHSSMPTISLVSSPSTGPVIHDVTDIDETSADMVELPNEEDEIDDTDELKDDSPLISEIFSTDLPIPLGVAVDHLQLNANNMQTEYVETELSNEQPDFNTMVEMETAGSSGNNGLLEKAMQGIASPLNPDLLMTVDPLEISNGGSRTESEERRNGKNIRGKSSPKKPDLSVALGEPSIIEREEFDNHLDTMQVDLEQLREVLSMQGSPLDASTLLGLFSTDDSLTSNNYLSFDMDMFRSPSQGAITGNEVIAYNNSLDMVGDELLTTNDTDKDTADLFDLLSQPDVASSASPVSSKKRKRN